MPANNVLVNLLAAQTVDVVGQGTTVILPGAANAVVVDPVVAIGVVEVVSGEAVGNLYIDNLAPIGVGGKYLWLQTGLGDGSGLTLWVEDGT